MNNEATTSQVKFYADTQQGDSNKLFCYPVHNFGHAIDIIIKFKRQGAKIRAAFFQGNVRERNMKIDASLYEDELLHETYSEKKRYEEAKKFN